VHAVIALALGGVPDLGIGLALLIAAKLWSEPERRLTMLLKSASADVRRYTAPTNTKSGFRCSRLDRRHGAGIVGSEGDAVGRPRWD